MRRTKLNVLPFLFLFGLGTGGCEYIELTDVSVDVEETDVDPEQLAETLAELAYRLLRAEVPEAAALSAPGVSLSRGGPGTGETFSRELSFTRECEGGGSVSFDGEVAGHVDRERRRAVTEFELRQVHAECAVAAGGAGLVLIGDPAIELTGRFELEDGEPVGLQKLNLAGGLRWESGSEGGACELDLLVKWDHENGRRYVRGRICEVELDVEAAIADD